MTKFIKGARDTNVYKRFLYLLTETRTVGPINTLQLEQEVIWGKVEKDEVITTGTLNCFRTRINIR